MRGMERARRLHRAARFLTDLAHVVRGFVALELAFRRAAYRRKSK
jgi:hypothetical protein